MADREGRLIRAFVALSFGISWAIWLPLAANSRGARWPTLPEHHFWGAAGPLAAALIVIARRNGRAGVARLLKSCFVPGRRQLPWMAFAVALPLALLAGALALTGSPHAFPRPGAIFLSLAFHTLTFGIGEEAGWRGFLLPGLRRTRGPLHATVLLTAIWAAWHIPAFFYRPGYAGMGAAAIAGWLLSLLTGSLLLTWLYERSGQSVAVVALFHGAMDVAFTADGAGAGASNWMGAALTILAPVLFFSEYGRSSRRRGRSPFRPPA